MKQTIGAVARALGMTTKTIRYYEDIGLVPHPQREGQGWILPGRRVYGETDIERLRFVKEARHLDFGIEDVKRLLAGYEAGPPCGCGARPLLKKLIAQKLEEIEASMRTLRELRTELRSLQDRTMALEGKTPAELLKRGVPTPSDAVFAPERREK